MKVRASLKSPHVSPDFARTRTWCVEPGWRFFLRTCSHQCYVELHARGTLRLAQHILLDASSLHDGTRI